MKAGWLPNWKAVAESMRMSLRRFAQPEKPQARWAGKTVIAARFAVLGNSPPLPLR